MLITCTDQATAAPREFNFETLFSSKLHLISLCRSSEQRRGVGQAVARGRERNPKSFTVGSAEDFEVTFQWRQQEEEKFNKGSL